MADGLSVRGGGGGGGGGSHWRSQDFIVGGAKLRPIQPVVGGGVLSAVGRFCGVGGGGGRVLSAVGRFGCCPLSADSTSVRGPL